MPWPSAYNYLDSIKKGRKIRKRKNQTKSPKILAWPSCILIPPYIPCTHKARLIAWGNTFQVKLLTKSNSLHPHKIPISFVNKQLLPKHRNKISTHTNMTPSTSNTMLADLDNYFPFLLGLFEASDWTSFENVAFSDPETYTVISMSICECEEFNGMTLLHACVRYEPPVSVLLKMIELHPQALEKEDCIGRTPPHIAAGSGALSLVMKVLTMKYPEACNIQDEDGSTPLHFACDSSCELFEDIMKKAH